MRKLLSEKEESFQLELSQSLIASKEELSKLSESREKKAQQWGEEKRQLEEMHVVKEKIWSHVEADMKEDINLLKQENIQLQVCRLISSYVFIFCISEDFRSLKVK